MIDSHDNSEETAVDDVRRVREAIARQHEGDLQGHIAETNRITGELLKKLNIRIVSAPPPKSTRDGTRG